MSSISLKISGLIFLVSILLLAYSIPLITISVQQVGEFTPRIHAIILYVYNPSNYDVYNYSTKIIINRDDVVMFDDLKKGFIFMNLSGTWLYGWKEYIDNNKAILWVKVPYIRSQSYTYIVLWYGDIADWTKEYNNPYETFLYFYNFSNPLIEFSNAFINLESKDVDYSPSDFIVNENYTIFEKQLTRGSEVSLISNSNFYYSYPVYIDFKVRPIAGLSRIFEVGYIFSDYSYYDIVGVDYDGNTPKFYYTDSFWSYFFGTEGTYISPSELNIWMIIELELSFYTYASAYNYYTNSYYFTRTLIGFESPVYYGNSFKLYIGQRNIYSSNYQNVNNIFAIQYVIIRPSIYPEPSYGIISQYTFIFKE